MGILSEVSAGWHGFLYDNKLPLLLLASFVFLFFRKEQKMREPFVRYTLLFTVLALFPLTAALLMTYQTRFYNYLYIWSFVPDIAVIAYAASLFAGEELPELYREKKSFAVISVVALAAAVLLCSGLVYRPIDAHLVVKTEHDCDAVLSVLQQKNEEELLVWAPEEVITYIGQNDSSVRLLYGRNMWDNQLNAYFFDTYPEELVSMYRWMEREDEETELGASECAELVKANAVNCVILYENAAEEDLAQFQAAFGEPAMFVGNYYIFIK